MNEQNGTNKMPLTCGRCGQAWSMDAPVMEISNTLRCSVVPVAHQPLVRCPNNKCRQPYLLGIQQAQVAFFCNAVADDVVEQMEGSKIVKPTLGLVG